MGRLSVNIIVYALLILCISTTLIQAAESSTYHTINIDGVNDFVADETLTSSTIGYNWYVTWDANKCYFGVQGTDVGSGASSKWIILYISGVSGTTSGLVYNTQSPTLPFPAKYHFRYRLDGNLMSLKVFNGTIWVDQGSGISVTKSGNYVEFAIPRADIGNLNFIKICGAMLNEANLIEWTYAMIPQQTAIDSYDPIFSHWLGYPLLPGVSPSSNIYVDDSPRGTIPLTILLLD
jgi:hypothetical protein